MAFKHEKITTQEDKDLFFSMGICYYNGYKHKERSTDWFADRENNAFLIETGSPPDAPDFSTLWWNGEKILVEAYTKGGGGFKSGYNIIWEIDRVKIPKSLWTQQEFILKLLQDAFAERNFFGKKFLDSLIVRFNREPELWEAK